ncbi:hypothetical protein [Streptomyces sp. WAC 05379]|uniref:hypothetical protein n=1 Tax=Streptomyces sp. WAC 05379 TaxID=2203207 RepID=UPI000F740A8D|nr:hypothetical protein [Streptomyces sp. WAC 05379]
MMEVPQRREVDNINNPTRKPARKLKAGDHLRLWNGKTAEILAIEEAVNQAGRKALILRLHKAGTMVVKRDRYMTMHYPQ